MKFSAKPKPQFQAESAQFIEKELKTFVRSSPLNCIPMMDNQIIFDEPLVQFAGGDDPIFTEYKTIIHSTHLTPREALAKTFNKSPEDIPSRFSVISWVLPFTRKIRESNRRHKLTPSRLWLNAYLCGEEFNDALREHVVELLTKMGYLAVAPVIQPYFTKEYAPVSEKAPYSNWSERHIAYAAGLGTFSLSDGFITERGIAHRCGSVVTNLVLPVSPRTAKNPYSNCLFYVNGSCTACIARCPVGAISENGHDKIKCLDKVRLSEKYVVEALACGLCQTGVPCEFRNPVKKASRKTE